MRIVYSSDASAWKQGKSWSDAGQSRENVGSVRTTETHSRVVLRGYVVLVCLLGRSLSQSRTRLPSVLNNACAIPFR